MQYIKPENLADGKGKSIIIYSRPGLGKTTALSQLQGKTLILNIDKSKSLSNLKKTGLWINPDIRVVSCDSKNILEMFNELDTKNPFDNICIDTISRLEDQKWTELTGKSKSGGREMQHYGVIDEFIRGIVEKFVSLTEKGTNVIFTAWEKDRSVEVRETGAKYTVLFPHFRNPDSICGMIDIVAKLETETIDKKRNRYFKTTDDMTSFAKDNLNGKSRYEFAELITTPEKKETK